MSKNYTYENLELKSVDELRAIAGKVGCSGYSKARKYDIIEMIMSATGGEVVTENLADKTVSDLKNIAGDLGMKVEKGVKKEDLVNRILAVSEGGKDKVNAFQGTLEASHNMIKGGPATISVSCGASSGKFPVVGKTVAAVGDFLKEILNIDINAASMVNGESVKTSYILEEGDQLEFVKQAGSKGN